MRLSAVGYCTAFDTSHWFLTLREKSPGVVSGTTVGDASYFFHYLLDTTLPKLKRPHCYMLLLSVQRYTPAFLSYYHSFIPNRDCSPLSQHHNECVYCTFRVARNEELTKKSLFFYFAHVSRFLPTYICRENMPFISRCIAPTMPASDENL